MKGLILKDIYNIKYNAKSMVFLLVLFAFIFIPQQGSIGYIAMSTILCSFMVVTTMSFDKMANWDKYALTMPLTRKDIVMSKYIILLVFDFIGVLCGVVISAIVDIYLGKFNGIELLSGVNVGISLSVIFSGIMLPLIYKFGVEKARMLMIACYLIPSLSIVGMSKLLSHFNLTMNIDEFTNVIMAILPVFSILLLAASYCISLRIYKKEEM